jgi:hypothetical protein
VIFMRLLLILVFITRCPILRYYMGAAGEVGSEVARDKYYTGGAVRDARRSISRGTRRTGVQCGSRGESIPRRMSRSPGT